MSQHSPRDPGCHTRESSFPAPLIRFVQLFNRGEFWESHEVLEGPWRDGGSGFYHGLILYASAFVHVQRNNAHGIRAQLRKAEEALQPYEPHYLGIDVTEILRRARRLRRRVEREEDGAHPPWEERVTFPNLTLEMDRLRGEEPEMQSPDN